MEMNSLCSYKKMTKLLLCIWGTGEETLGSVTGKKGKFSCMYLTSFKGISQEFGCF
jgi:hypothetical protein